MSGAAAAAAAAAGGSRLPFVARDMWYTTVSGAEQYEWPKARRDSSEEKFHANASSDHAHVAGATRSSAAHASAHASPPPAGKTALPRPKWLPAGEEVLFSDVVVKVNERNKQQRRVLVLTDRALYNASVGLGFKWSMPLADIQSVGTSLLDDNFFIVYARSHKQDLLYWSARKSEIIGRLVQAFPGEHASRGRHLRVVLQNELHFRARGQPVKALRVRNAPDGVRAAIEVMLGADGRPLPPE